MSRPRLGREERVWVPAPLSSVTILAMGASSSVYMTERFRNWNWHTDQVWALNTAAASFRHDVAFNMHDLEELQKREPDKDYLGFYKTLDTPLVTIRALDELPNSLEYPLAEIVEEYNDSYFAVGLSYLVAAAAYAGARQIYLYGADFNYPGRKAYEAGRANLEYWIGMVRGKYGALTAIPAASTCCDMIYRTGDRKGQIGYGQVYGYFDRQPIFGEGKVTGFHDLPPSMEQVEASIEEKEKKVVPLGKTLVNTSPGGM